MHRGHKAKRLVILGEFFGPRSLIYFLCNCDDPAFRILKSKFAHPIKLLFQRHGDLGAAFLEGAATSRTPRLGVGFWNFMVLLFCWRARPTPRSCARNISAHAPSKGNAGRAASLLMAAPGKGQTRGGRDVGGKRYIGSQARLDSAGSGAEGSNDDEQRHVLDSEVAT